MADHTAPPFLAPLPLVGRERELAALRAALDAALAGRGSLVLIGGEAGLGKTVLAEALLAEAAEQGALALVGRCYDLSETPPYGPWRELFARAPSDADLPTLPTALLPLDHGGEALTSQEAIFARVVAYLAALAARCPLVLLLDDLHWADPASLELLRFLAREVGASPICFLVTYRADELTRRHPLYHLLPALVREARAIRVDLRHLGDRDVRAFVARAYPLPAGDLARLVAYLHAHAEGNPFYVGELLRTLVEVGALHPEGGGWAVGDLDRVPVPALLRQVIDGRLARLGEDARGLLAVAATIGQEVPLEVWQAASGGAEEALLDVLERAVEAHVLAPTSDGARFTHALIREALYEGVVPLRRRAWHRRVAELLAERPGPDPDAVAFHFRQCGDGRAVGWLARAGERAQRAYAWLTAAERYEAALALLEAGGAAAAARGWLLFRLAALRRFADERQALGDAEAAALLGREADDRLLAGMATFLAGMVRCYLGKPRHGIAQMEAGLDALDALPLAGRVPPGATQAFDPASRRGTVVQWLAHVGRFVEARALGERHLAAAPVSETADWLGGSGYADAYRGLGLAYAALGEPERAGPLYARAGELYRAIGHHVQVAYTAEQTLWAVGLRYRADRPGELQRLLAEAVEAFARAGGLSTERLWTRGWLLLVAGRWGEVRPVALAGRDEPRARTALGHRLVLLQLAQAQGERDQAWALVHAILPAGPASEPGEQTFLLALDAQRLAVALALDAADLPTARQWLTTHDRWLDWSGAVLGRAEGHLGWAAAHRAMGDPGPAREHAERALAHAAEPRQPLALLAAHRLLGELDTEAGRHTDAQAHLDAALNLADACAAPYERALSLLALAGLRLATGDRDGTGAALEEAHAILAPLDARPALARADALAARLAAIPTPRQALPAGLTAREAEVLRLVAEGLTNAQVAERLFLSPRTVDRHLNAAYTKLGVTSRAAATRFAVEHGLA